MVKKIKELFEEIGAITPPSRSSFLKLFFMVLLVSIISGFSFKLIEILWKKAFGTLVRKLGELL